MNEKSRDIRENWVDPDDAPELMDEFFEHGEWKIGDRIVSRSEGETEVKRKLRGRPPQETRKIPTSIGLSPKVISHFRATGKGWQTRIDAALIEWMREHG